jgi:hypothetical protein
LAKIRLDKLIERLRRLQGLIAVQVAVATKYRLTQIIPGSRTGNPSILTV